MTSFIFLMLIVLVYLLPGVIASNRKHHNRVPIWLVTIFFGWSVLGWFGALIWSFSNPAPRA